MLASVTGIYENGQIVLSESPPSIQRSKVVVTFLDENNDASIKNTRIGGMKGLIDLPDDFNEPLDDLKDYMA